MLVKTSDAQTEETFKEPKYDSKGGGGRQRLLGGLEIWDEREKKMCKKKSLFFSSISEIIDQTTAAVPDISNGMQQTKIFCFYLSSSTEKLEQYATDKS